MSITGIRAHKTVMVRKCKYILQEMKTNVNLWHFYRGQMARLHVIESTAFFSLINYPICIKFHLVNYDSMCKVMK